MKKIFIDIYHLPQFNLFKQSIHKLGPDKVEIGCVNRGKLVEVIQNECPDFKLHVLGDYRHNNGRLSMAFLIIIPRLFRLLLLLRKSYHTVGSAHYQANFIAKLLRIPNFSILDDPRAGVVEIVRFSTKEFYLPNFEQQILGSKVFEGLKEWAYLSPSYFHPTLSALEAFNLTPFQYIFLREVTTNTSNYLGQKESQILEISHKIPEGTPVVLSLEDKSSRHLYPSHWHIVEEPFDDFHSLLYYSSLTASTGDSIAREGSMLGAPSFYIGDRDMPANQVLIDLKLLEKIKPHNLLSKITEIYPLAVDISDRETIRNELEEQWDDVTQLILNLSYNLGTR
jgi:predicted glycosyltransferase